MSNEELDSSICIHIGQAEGRTIYPENALSIIQEILLIDSVVDNDTPINIWLYSLGGDVEAGFALYDAIKGLESPTKIICFGQVMSTALVLLQAATERVTFPHTRFMHHTPSQEGGVTSPELVTYFYETYMMNMKLGDDVIRKRSTISKKEWRANWNNTTCLEFGAEEALRFGLVDRIVHTFKEI